MSFKEVLQKVTSPILVPMRRIVAWFDQTLGVCDHTLVVMPRDSEYPEEDDGLMKNLGNLIVVMGCYVFNLLALFTLSVLLVAAVNQEGKDELWLLSLSAALNTTLAAMCIGIHRIVKS